MWRDLKKDAMRLFKRRHNTRGDKDGSKEKSKNEDGDVATGGEASVDVKLSTSGSYDSKNKRKSQINIYDVALDGEESLDLNQILTLHDLSDKAMEQAVADQEECDEMENSSQISLTIDDLLDHQDTSDPPAAQEKDTFPHNESIIKIGHASDVSIMINLATEYSNHRNHSSLQLSSKPWEAVTEQPHQRRQRRENANLNCNFAGASLQVRRQKMRKDSGSKRGMSWSHSDINYDHAGNPSFAVTDSRRGNHPEDRRHRMSRSRSTTGSTFSSSTTGTSRPSPRGGPAIRGRHASLKPRPSRSKVLTSTRITKKENIISPRKKGGRIRAQPQRSRVEPQPSRSMLQRSTSSPSILRQASGKQKTVLDGARSSPRKERVKIVDDNKNSATGKKVSDKNSSNRIRRRYGAPQKSPSKLPNKLGGSFSSFGNSSFMANDLDFGGSFSSLAHTSFNDLQQLAKERERKSRCKQNRMIKKDLLVNAYPIDFGPMSAVAHAPYYSLSKVKEEQQQANDDDIESREGIQRKSLEYRNARKQTITREVSKQSSEDQEKIRRRRHQRRSRRPKEDNKDTLKISQSSLATYTDTTDTTAQLSASFSSQSTTFSGTLQAMKQQAFQQQHEEFDDRHGRRSYKEHC